MKTVFHKVLDHPNLIKDTGSKAVLNTDPGAVARHEQRMVKIRKEQKIEAEINNLKSEMGDIKNLLTQILGKLNG